MVVSSSYVSTISLYKGQPLIFNMLSTKAFRSFPNALVFFNFSTKRSSKGVKIIKNSDGNVKAILEDLIEIGYDGFNPVEPQCMDIVEVKHQMSGRASVQGNIDCMYLLPFGT